MANYCNNTIAIIGYNKEKLEDFRKLMVDAFRDSRNGTVRDFVIKCGYDKEEAIQFTDGRDTFIDIDDEMEERCRALSFHVSQVFEWLAYEAGVLEQVPEDDEARYEWLRGEHIDENTPDKDILARKFSGQNQRVALVAAKYREKLVERYGDAGNRVVYAEAYAVCEYGSPLTEEKKQQIFPY